MPVLDNEELGRYFPSYLTDDQKRLLAQELRSFRDKMPYYTSMYPDEVLQGDGWTKFALVDFDTGKGRSVRGIVLSNTCDIDPNNERILPVNVLFAPIVGLAAYAQKVADAGMPLEKIGDKLDAIRRQDVTSVFYLPAGGGLTEEHIALLDDVHPMRVERMYATEGRTKLFTLSQGGIYLFLLKLSMHFCRFHDRVVRYADGVQSPQKAAI